MRFPICFPVLQPHLKLGSTQKRKELTPQEQILGQTLVDNGRVSTLVNVFISIKNNYSTECQGKEADVVFVIDTSSSIWPTHFNEQMDFVSKVVDNFDINSGKTQVKCRIDIQGI